MRWPVRQFDTGIDVALSVTSARMLARLSPRALETIMRFVSRGSMAATFCVATKAHADVIDSSIGMAGPHSCLPRSISVALLCRIRGYWPRWCVGVRTHPPFAAHAWIEAEERMIGEFTSPGAYQTMISIDRR